MKALIITIALLALAAVLNLLGKLTDGNASVND